LSETKLTIEDMQAYLNVEAEPHVLHIEKELVRRFLEAVQDANPLWADESALKSGGALVPPQLFCAIMTIARCSSETGKIPVPVASIPLPRRNVLEGEETWEFFTPLRVGDSITSRTRLTDAKVREGKLGEMFILTYVAESVNQRGELVARSSNTIVNY
jgi:acyl dehydratase